MTTALILAGAVVLLAVAVGMILRTQDGRRRSGGVLRLRAEDLPGGAPGSTILVQFSTELCARCPQVRRLLDDIARSANIAHAEIDLTHRSDLAARYRVLQTPTTFLVDASGAVLSRWAGVPERRSIEDALAARTELREEARQHEEKP